MKRNEKGVAVPGEPHLLPWTKGDRRDVLVVGICINDAEGCLVALGLWSDDDADFINHAANYHERFAEIVRRFSEWHDQDDDTIDILPIVTAAAALWKEYQEEPT